MIKPFAFATLVAGTLDILFAVILTLLLAKDPANMLRSVASGPFPGAPDWGAGGAILGLVVHFTLMAIMVGTFVVVAIQRPAVLDRPVVAIVAFGLITYVAMNLIVVPLRFPAAFPPKLLSVATQLFAHLVLVAIPTVLITANYLRPREAAGTAAATV